MRCFIHINEEAVAACRTCGKGMCQDCSAYSGHTGICPECRKKDFEKELRSLEEANKTLSGEITWLVVGAILLCWTIIAPIWNIISIIIKNTEKGKNNERITVLTQEINRLNKVLAQRGGRAFI